MGKHGFLFWKESSLSLSLPLSLHLPPPTPLSLQLPIQVTKGPLTGGLPSASDPADLPPLQKTCSLPLDSIHALILLNCISHPKCSFCHNLLPSSPDGVLFSLTNFLPSFHTVIYLNLGLQHKSLFLSSSGHLHMATPLIAQI